MTDNSKPKRPLKGILKSSSSFDQTDLTPKSSNKRTLNGTDINDSSQPSTSKKSASQLTLLNERKQQDIKWDEMNILQTLHPPDKDYGFMKIDEPKTPYNYLAEDEDALTLDPEVLAKKITLESDKLPKAMQVDEEDSDTDRDETEEERAKRKAFEYRRKVHYNEFYAVKLARKLMDQDEDEEDNDEDITKMNEDKEDPSSVNPSNENQYDNSQV